MKILRVSYSLLVFFLVVSVIAYLLIPPDSEGWRSFTLNLLTEIVGILLTILLIDAVIRRRETREQKRYRSVTLQQMRIPLIQHLHLLFNMYKASVEEKPTKDVANVADLFTDDYLKEIQYLDLGSPGPVHPPMQWFEYMNLEINRMHDALGRVVDKYAMYLDPDTLDVAEQLINSPLVNTVGHFRTMYGLQCTPAGQDSPFVPLFGLNEVVHDHVHAFSKLVEIYNEEVSGDRKIAIEDPMWLNNAHPLIGSGRALVHVVDPDPTPDNIN